jgi:hypothetical protein
MIVLCTVSRGILKIHSDAVELFKSLNFSADSSGKEAEFKGILQPFARQHGRYGALHITLR